MNPQSSEDRRLKRARLIRDGMSWRQACLQSGYSLAVANKGPKSYIQGGNEHRTRRPGIAKDFERAAEEAAYKPEFIKKAVTHRLMSSVIEGKPSNVAREAELLGRMKDVDLFVRSGDMQIGILATLVESLPLEDVDLDAYRDS